MKPAAKEYSKSFKTVASFRELAQAIDKMKMVDFKTSAYASGTMYFVGIVLVFAGLLMLAANNLVGLGLLIVSVLILTTHYRLKIDFENKLFHDYLWILGMKYGEKGKFEKVEYLFVKTSKVSQTMYMKSLSTTIRKDVFDGYLRFSADNKVHLMTLDSKDELIRKLKVIAGKVKTRIVDYTDGNPREITI